jgi:hypothetical protein
MSIDTSIQNTWKAEGMFHVLPSFALYYNNSYTKDYGIVSTWLFFSFTVEIWFD